MFDYGYPILRCGAGKITVGAIPVLSPDKNMTSTKSEVTVSPNGSVSGTTTTVGAGPDGHVLRSFMTDVEKKGADAVMTDKFKELELSGTARFEVMQPSAANALRSIKTQFSIDENLLGEHNGEKVLTGPRIASGGWTMAMSRIIKPERKEDFLCFGSGYNQVVTYRLPPMWKIKKLPKDVNLRRGPFEYTASYRQNGDAIEIKRIFKSQPESATCPAATAGDLASVARAARRDEEQRLTFVPADGETP